MWFNSFSPISNSELAAAVHHNEALSKEGLLERLFTFLFSGLVYPQIWEDPVVDMAALQIKSDDHIVAIASGGCNIASYLTADPKRITAVDLNPTHIALNELKMAAIKYLSDHASFYRFFGNASDPRNIATYDQTIALHLTKNSRAYWERRDLIGRRNITQFSRGFYHYGLLGSFIGLVHFISRLHGVELRKILLAKTLEEQRQAFHTVLSPLFEKPLLKFLVNHPASLYGLGIPPAQYRSLAADHSEGMIGALRDRVQRLTCDFEFQHNYFAWQAFHRSYSPFPDASVPPYLHEDHFQRIKQNVDRVEVRQISMTAYLSSEPANTKDCYVLLDAQDWMTDTDLNALWVQITRTAKQNARVIFRTAANERLLPNRVKEEILSGWVRHDHLSDTLHKCDRSAIYGAFHLYEFKGR